MSALRMSPSKKSDVPSQQIVIDDGRMKFSKMTSPAKKWQRRVMEGVEEEIEETAEEKEKRLQKEFLSRVMHL